MPISHIRRHEDGAALLFSRALLCAGFSGASALLVNGATPPLAAAQITLSTPVAELGNPRDSVQSYGKIRALSADNRGNVYVLDDESRKILVFGLDGRFRLFVGGWGHDLGKFWVPTSMAVDDKGALHVLDPGAHRISHYEWTNARLQPTSSNRVDIDGSGLCALEDRLYILGSHNDYLVHEIGANGKIKKSFGVPFGYGNENAQVSLSFGHIACVPSRGAVVVVSTISRQARSYSVAGKLLWSTRVPGNRYVVIRERSDGSVAFITPRGGYSAVRSMVVVSSEMVLVQTELVGAAENRSSGSDVQSVFLALSDGAQLGRQHGLPRFAAARPPYIFSVPDQPFSRALIFRFKLHTARQQ